MPIFGAELRYAMLRNVMFCMPRLGAEQYFLLKQIILHFLQPSP